MIPGYIHLLAWVYGLGLLAAAPVGPVNMLAIHRGVASRWSHTLACGMGSALVDLFYFTLAMWGGKQALGFLSEGTAQDVLALAFAAMLVPMGIVFLVRAVRLNLRTLLRSRRRRPDAAPLHLWTDVGTGAALTIINPAAPAYWLAAGVPWFSRAKDMLGEWAIGWGLVAAGAGLMSWFVFLTVLVRFAPHRLGLRFFRTVNGLCGVVLLAFAAYCGYLVIHNHFAL
jgi:L-lysine exporter family protein LysE/ArgO